MSTNLQRCGEFWIIVTALGTVSLTYDILSFDSNYQNTSLSVVNIQHERFEIYAKHQMNECQDARRWNDCEYALKWGVVGTCHDTRKVECFGDFYWLDDYGYQITNSYPRKNMSNYHPRSVIHKEDRWNVTVDVEPPDGSFILTNLDLKEAISVGEKYSPGKVFYRLRDRYTGKIKDEMFLFHPSPLTQVLTWIFLGMPVIFIGVCLEGA